MSTETITTTPAATEKPAEKRNEKYVAITLTPALVEALKAKAGTESWGLFCRNIVARELGVTVEVTRSAPKKYATEEEKKAAHKAAAKEKNELMKRLMAEYKEKLAAAQKLAAGAA